MYIFHQLLQFDKLDEYVIHSLQTNYPAGDNGNQLLESIGDSNSSSSFDMERRSFSSNSNQSTIGNYNSDHSTAFSTSSQQINGTHSLPSVLSSMSSAVSGGTASTPNFTYSDINTQHRKPSNLLPFTPSPDDRSNNASQINDIYNSNTLSAMQSSSLNSQPTQMHSSGLNTSAALSSLGDYTMQMNDLINDDNGDGLDMSFWENFDSFNYEADLVMANNKSHHHHPQTQGKSSTKRSHDGTGADRKRKKGNEPKDSSSHSKILVKDGTKAMSASPIPMDGSQFMMKSSASATPQKKSIHLTASSSITSHNILIDSTPSEVICIDDDEDDATNNNIGERMGRRKNSGKFCQFFISLSV